MKKRTFAITILAVIVIAIGIGAMLLSSAAYYIPENFTEGREHGAEAAKKISSLISESLDSLSQISDADRRGTLWSALTLIDEEVAKTVRRQDEATILASAME